MAYTIIPEPTDHIDNSQLALKNNFIAIKALVDVNHVTFDDANQGKHKWVTFPDQAAVVPVTGANDATIFYGNYGTGKTLLMSVAGAAPVPVNASIGSSGQFGPPDYQGWTRLPSGILMKWAQGEWTGPTTFTWKVDPSIPAFTSVYHCQVTTRALTDAANTDAYVLLQTFNTLTADVYINKRTSVANATTRFQIFCIGI